MKLKLKWTGERLETNVFSRDTIDHLHRYAITTDYIKDKVVLDIACGEGYGSNLMSDHAKFVYGVDINLETIQNAQNKYQKENLNFLVGNTNKMPIESNSIDVLISYETIEHHDEHEQMMNEIKRVLKPDGILFISTPDKHYYSDLRNFKNSFHVKELYKNEFEELINKHFSNSQLLNQSSLNGSSLIAGNEVVKKIKFYNGTYTKIENIESDLTYMIAIASEVKFNLQDISIFDGIDVNKKIISNIEKNIFNSNSYKLGKFLLSPFSFIKKILK